MDIGETLRQLREQRARLIAVIAQLESLHLHDGRPTNESRDAGANRWETPSAEKFLSA